MNDYKFRIDLGQGDLMDVTIRREGKFTLANLIDEMSKTNWVTFGDATVQKIHIKRIVML
ncbi:hypothetical protein WKH56_20070 [Priestia sp. SB1]|uniref:hypothetical protein n=1 Tax=Priestia sp. SB1 TaxID=3132359 RepID=UPI003177DB10